MRSFTITMFFLPLAFLVSCNQTENREKAGKITNETILPLEIGRNIEFVYSDSGVVKAILKAPMMESYSQLEEPYTEMREGFQVTFFDENKNPNSFLTANYGIQRINEKVIEAQDSVVVVNTQGDTLKSEELIWDEVKNKIYSNKQVRVRTADETIIGDGFKSNPQFTQYEFRNITGRFTIQDEEDDQNE